MEQYLSTNSLGIFGYQKALAAWLGGTVVHDNEGIGRQQRCYCHQLFEMMRRRGIRVLEIDIKRIQVEHKGCLGWPGSLRQPMQTGYGIFGIDGHMLTHPGTTLRVDVESMYLANLALLYIAIKEQGALPVTGPIIQGPHRAGFDDNKRVRELVQIGKGLAKGGFPVREPGSGDGFKILPKVIEQC